MTLIILNLISLNQNLKLHIEYAGDIEDLSVQETFKWWEYYEGYYLQDYVSTPKHGGFGKIAEDFASQFQDKIEVGAVV